MHFVAAEFFMVYCSTNWEQHGTRAFFITTNEMTIGYLNETKEPFNQFFQIVNKLGAAKIDCDAMDGKGLTIGGKQIFQPGEFGIYIPQKIY